jgi:Sap, sulfolipid-1-addressing protein
VASLVYEPGSIAPRHHDVGRVCDVVLITAPKPVKVSAAFVAGVAITTTIGVLVALALISLLGNSIPLGSTSTGASVGHVIHYVLIGVLVVAAIKNYVQREKIEPPRWRGRCRTPGQGGLS